MYSINADTKFRELVERYQREDTASLSSNKSRINRVILPLWGDVPLARREAARRGAEGNELPASKKPKLHIKAMMHKIFNFGPKGEMVAPQPNPMRFRDDSRSNAQGPQETHPQPAAVQKAFPER